MTILENLTTGPVVLYAKLTVAAIAVAAVLGFTYRVHLAFKAEKEFSELKAENKLRQDKVGVNNTLIETSLRNQLVELQKKSNQAEETWKQLGQTKDSKIAGLQASINARAKTIEDLKVKLAGATPEDKPALESQINLLENENETDTTRRTSLECLSVPIPAEAIKALNQSF